MSKYIIPLLLAISFAKSAYACGCLPLNEEPPIKYVPFTVTSVQDGIYTAIDKKKQIVFKKNLITDGNELSKGDVVLAKESNDDENHILGVELFISHEELDTNP